MNRTKLRFLILAVFILNSALAHSAPLFIDQPGQLQLLEKNGFDFARLVFSSVKPGLNNNVFYTENKSYQAMVDSLTHDLQELKKTDARLSSSMKSVHRLFDSHWLKSPDSFFELVGVVSRFDRAPFAPESCGEIRFIYRLAYRKNTATKIYSRLPMTINAVFWAQPKDNCLASAKQWQSFATKLSTKSENQQWSGFKPKLAGLKSVEVNLQSVRWPSTVRPDMAGYAEYFLRVFKLENSKLVVSELENTPDIDRINSSIELKNRLLAWLKMRSNLESIDQGVIRLPKEFLAKKINSFALHGVHRLANAPFTQIFAEKDFKDINFSKRRSFQSAHGLLRRLNDFSCAGCHQGRTVAGFHFLGKDRQDTDAVNSIFVSSSPHFLSDQKRRIRFFESVMQQKTPSAFRPISVRAEEELGVVGAHCGMGDPSFARWTCAQGFRCEQTVKDQHVSKTGICEAVSPIAGASCQPGLIKHHPNPHKDRVVLLAKSDCREQQHCENSAVGFPNGMCSGSCSNLESGEICGAIAILQGFNDCLARGKNPFNHCLVNNVRPAALKNCSDIEPCRDDYICTRTSDKKGACIPPYFLFQLRVDGHPKP